MPPATGNLVAQLTGQSSVALIAKSSKPRPKTETVILTATHNSVQAGKRVRLTLKLSGVEQRLLKRGKLRALALRLTLIRPGNQQVLQTQHNVHYRR